MKYVLSLILVTFFLSAAGFAQPINITEVTRTLLNKATLAYANNTMSKASKLVSTDTSYRFREYCVEVYDTTGKCLASGSNPADIGKNFATAKDADGKFYIKEMIAKVKRFERGIVRFRFMSTVLKGKLSCAYSIIGYNNLLFFIKLGAAV